MSYEYSMRLRHTTPEIAPSITTMTSMTKTTTTARTVATTSDITTTNNRTDANTATVIIDQLDYYVTGTAAPGAIASIIVTMGMVASV